ncbi:hypothetical protein [Ensifer aridi]|uniref:hypothetical protein n=1 Tax=Ensifer aridi TaxID=1708715 RepID=UPI00041CE2EA|nr:hypothetical protein [Ensifer aridi]
MARVAVIGFVGEEGLYVVDLDSGKVAPLTVPSTSPLQTVVDLKTAGATVVKGINVAIGVESVEDAFHGRFDG